ncbi:hypothetical protein ACRAR1_26335 [Streptomyces sanyensis]|uniref:hypothetical protein n=1 Tax=Streptomyces sanyensis TaxID=568869 RepID=UPI003D785B6D
MTGESADIEFLYGRPCVHHEPAYTVMTESLPFDQQQPDHLGRYEGFGGALPPTGEPTASYAPPTASTASRPPAPRPAPTPRRSK